MKVIGGMLALLSFAALAFGVWGLYTDAGRKMFDEMDGLYPFFSLVGGGVLLFVAIVLAVLGIRRAARHD